MINPTFYDRRVVLALFAQTHPGKLNPTSAEIGNFDDNLKNALDATLEQAMGQSGIPIDIANKSQILLYRPSMPGGIPTRQIENACAFFQNTAGII